MSSVDLDYAYKLASTLMWKRFGDEKPKAMKRLIIKDCSRQATFIGIYKVLKNLEQPLWSEPGAQNHYCATDDLWIYLSDLDVLKIKGE